jgi:hypothetical protein
VKYERSEIFTPTTAQAAPVPVGGDANALWKKSAYAMQKAEEAFVSAAAEEGMRDGSQLTEEGKAVVPKIKKGIGTISKAYNENALRAYTASAEEDMRLALDESYMANDSDTRGFEASVKSFEDSYFKDIPEEAKPFLLPVYAKRKNALIGKVGFSEASKIEKQNRDFYSNALGSSLERAKAFARNGDLIELQSEQEVVSRNLTKMVDSGYVTQEEADGMLANGQKEVNKQGVIGEVLKTYYRDGESAATEMVQAITAKVPDGWTVDEAQDFNKLVLTQLNQAKTEDSAIRTQEEIQKEFAYSDLIVNSKADNFGGVSPSKLVEQADQFLYDGYITSEQRAAIFRNVNTNLVAQQQKNTDYGAIASRLGGDDSVIIDTKTADKFYTEVFLKQKNTPQDKANFVERMKYVPSGLTQEIKQGVLSDNPEVMASSANLIDRIDAVPGISTDYLSPTERAIANRMNSLVKVMPPEDAAKLTRQVTDPANRNLVESREVKIKENLKNNPDFYTEVVDDALDKPFILTGDYKVSERSKADMAREFESTANGLYLAGYSDNIQDAMEKSKELVSKNWGADDIGGTSTFRKYPLSWYYSVNGETDYIKEQLEVDALAIAGYPVSYENIVLLSDNKTAYTASTGAPQYAMLIISDDGTPLPAGGYWSPDKKSQVEKVKAENVKMSAEIREEAKDAPVSEFYKKLFSAPVGGM